jgi:hypothetical protein
VEVADTGGHEVSFESKSAQAIVWTGAAGSGEITGAPDESNPR